MGVLRPPPFPTEVPQRRCLTSGPSQINLRMMRSSALHLHLAALAPIYLASQCSLTNFDTLAREKKPKTKRPIVVYPSPQSSRHTCSFFLSPVFLSDSALCHNTLLGSRIPPAPPTPTCLCGESCLLIHSKCQTLPNKSTSLFFFHANPPLIDTLFSPGSSYPTPSLPPLAASLLLLSPGSN